VSDVVDARCHDDVDVDDDDHDDNDIDHYTR
jgi:hypothetical protein